MGSSTSGKLLRLRRNADLDMLRKPNAVVNHLFIKRSKNIALKIIDTIKESIAKHTIEWIIGLISPLLAGIALGLKSLISEKLLPALSKGLLFGIVVGCIALLLIETAYVIYLRAKLLEKKEPVLDDMEKKISKSRESGPLPNRSPR
jgi:hypothetical protein